MDVEKIKANIAARKAREAQEAIERAQNNGKTLAEIKHEREQASIRQARQMAHDRQADRFNQFMYLLDRAMGTLPPLTDEQKAQADERNRVAELQDKAEKRFIENFGV